jgi:hypothetical protein
LRRLAQSSIPITLGAAKGGQPRLPNKRYSDYRIEILTSRI